MRIEQEVYTGSETNGSYHNFWHHVLDRMISKGWVLLTCHDDKENKFVSAVFQRQVRDEI